MTDASKIAVNRLPAVDAGDGLDLVFQLFQNSLEGEATLLVAEACERFEELPVSILIAVLTMSKGRQGVRCRDSLYQLTKLTMQRRGRSDDIKLLSGLR